MFLRVFIWKENCFVIGKVKGDILYIYIKSFFIIIKEYKKGCKIYFFNFNRKFEMGYEGN